jgi:hypothetical protein
MSQRITVQNAGRFALAGDAIFTMVRPQVTLIDGERESINPEKRFTYRIQRAKPKDGEEADPLRPWFVKVLSGPNNTQDYHYLGTIFPSKWAAGMDYRHGRKSRVAEDAPSSKGIAWFIRHLNKLIVLRAELEGADMFRKPEIEASILKVESTLNKLLYYHQGKCGRCARKLTVPESIINGIGPVCAEKTGEKLDLLDFLARL